MKQIADTSPLREKYPCYKTFQYRMMDDYHQRLKEHNVEKTVVIPSVFREHSKQEENLKNIDFAQKNKDMIFPYALLDEDDVYFVDRYYTEIVGVKEHIVLHRSELSPWKKEIFAQVQEHGLILLLHSEAMRRVEYVKTILKNFPFMKIQVAHMGRAKPGDEAFMIGVLKSLQSYENVYFDTSTIRQPEIVEKAICIVGAQRILYGSDFPFFMDENGTEDIMEEQLQHILKAHITEQQREDIFTRNFNSFIKRGV
jgi:predicted TIM-barrel fold metal-dependent hydrolase